MNWYYIDGPRRVGPMDEPEWAALVREGKIRPETLVWHEGMGQRWVPFSEIPPESLPMEAEPAEQEPASEPETPEAFVERVTPQDYPVRLGACVSRGCSVLFSRFGLLVGTMFVFLALSAVSSMLPVLEYLFPLLFYGVLLGGVFHVYLGAMRGQPVEISDLFAGFRPPGFMQLVLQTLVSATVWQLCFLPSIIAMKVLGVDPTPALNAARNGTFEALAIDPQTAMVLLLVLLACVIPAFYFAFCWMFSIPLIIDRGLPFWPAMQLSRRKVLQHPWRIGVLAAAAGLVSAAGLVFFGVGVILTAPLYPLVMLQLYEEMFAPQSNQPTEPGKPEA